MNWLLSQKLQPGEEVVDEPQESTRFGIKSVYSPTLTNKRVIFKFNTLSSGLVQSFPYEDISDAQPATRLLVKYLKLTARRREHFLNVDDPESLAEKIMSYKRRLEGGEDAGAHARKPPSMQELLAMLGTLREYGLLTPDEYEAKRSKLM